MTWHDAAARAELPAGGWLEVAVGRVGILLYDINDTLYATAAICPHHAAWFSQGSVEGYFVNCPRHMGQFHIPTGEQTRGPQCPALRVYPVRVAQGRVWVELDVCVKVDGPG